MRRSRNAEIVVGLALTIGTLVVAAERVDAADAAAGAGLDAAREALETEQYRQALQWAEERVESLGGTAAPGSVELAAALDLWVDAAHRGELLGYAELVALAGRAVDVRAALFPRDADYGRSLARRGAVHRRFGKYPPALEDYRAALAALEPVVAKQSAELVPSLRNIGDLAQTLNDYAAARVAYDRALAIQQATDAPPAERARVLNNYGLMLRDLGDMTGARNRMQAALELRQRAFDDPDHAAICASKNNLAIVIKDQGDYATARRMYEEVLDSRLRTLPADDRRLAKSRVNLANLLLLTGDAERALPLFDAAVETFAADPRARALLGLALNGRGAARVQAGRHAEAAADHERALELVQSAFGERHSETARTLSLLGNARRSLGATEQALELMLRARQIRLERFGSDHASVATIDFELGRLELDRNRPAEAQRYLQQSVRVRSLALGAEHPELAKPLSLLALSSLLQGDFEAAAEQAMAAERIGLASLRVTAPTLPERQALRYAARRGRGLDLALSTLSERPDQATTRAVADTLVRSRAVVLDEVSSRRRRALESAAPELQAAVERFEAASRDLAGLWVRGVGRDSVEEYRQRLMDAARDREAAERALAEQSSSFARYRRGADAGLQAVLDALPQGTALVAYVQFTQHRSEADRGETPTPRHHVESSYGAFVLRADEPSRFVHLGGAEPIDAAIAAWQHEAARGLLQHADANTAERRYRSVAGTLRRAVWDPLWGAAAEGAGLPRAVFLVPDGALHLVSFQALPTTTGYLIEAPTRLHRLTAERELVEPPQALGSGLLALGAADYDDRSVFPSLAQVTPVDEPQRERNPLEQLGRRISGWFRGSTADCAEFDSMRFAPLEATGQEVEELARLWRADPQVGDTATLLTSAEAGEAELKRVASGRRILHLATHGFFLGSECSVAPDGSRGSAAVLQATSEANPLLLSGLALSGANHRAAVAADEEDGILTAEEVSALNLQGLEWVVLSACNTGVGRLDAGEGVFGLQRAFHIAGARTTVMSLWAVDDRATRRWMQALYRARLVEGMDTPGSVRAAGLKQLRERRRRGRDTHPFRWGGFVASGDWR